jgi:hypothetical protein
MCTRHVTSTHTHPLLVRIIQLHYTWYVDQACQRRCVNKPFSADIRHDGRPRDNRPGLARLQHGQHLRELHLNHLRRLCHRYGILWFDIQ